MDRSSLEDDAPELMKAEAASEREKTEKDMKVWQIIPSNNGLDTTKQPYFSGTAQFSDAAVNKNSFSQEVPCLPRRLIITVESCHNWRKAEKS